MSTVTGSQIVYMNQGLFDILKTVGAQRVPMPISQVIDHMRTYILRKKLFNPTCPSVIVCENDPLGAIFGVPKFDTKEAIKHLARNLYRVPQQTVSQAQKREAPSASTDTDASTSKRVCREPKEESKAEAERPPVSPAYVCVPSSPKYNSESETDLSVQKCETEYVTDSSDDSTDVRWSTSDDSDTQSSLELEFEVESTDKEPDDYKSPSDMEDTVHKAIVLHVKDEDCEFWADFSDSDSDSEDSRDFEIGENDLWQCRLCKSRNTPLLRYCQTCWKERFGWLPNRTNKHPPQRKHYRKRQRSTKCALKEGNEEKQMRSTVTAKDASCLPSETPADGSNASQETSQEPQSDVPTESSQEATQGSQEAVTASSQEMPSPNTLYDMCNICLLRPKCAVIIHGRTCHRFSCYKCARQLLERKQPCPVCRRTIERVARSFDA